MTLFDFIIIIIAAFFFIMFMLPGVRNNRWWRAMVTPLASIIGSGFLVVAPLLGHVAGSWAVLAMFAIVALAYIIGAVIRFNIINAEPLVETGKGSRNLMLASRISDMALTVAYVISVAFYIRLLSSFVLSMTPLALGKYEDWLATVVLAMIAIVGWLRGLKGLEFVETISVSVKLSIIAALLAALFVHDFSNGTWSAQLVADDVDLWTRLRMLGGMLLVVQGFETSRYLENEYPAKVRHDTMAGAQIVSAIIYILFIFLVVPVLVFLPSGKASETDIIGLTGHVAMVLPFMLVVAAFMSQLSAAIADTVGAGGLVMEETGKRISDRASYPVLIGFSILLIWTFNIFEVISIASRAFAFYYLMQTIIAWVVAGKVLSGKPRKTRQIWFVLLAVLLLMIVVFALPSE